MHSKGASIRVLVNGVESHVRIGATLLELLQELGKDPRVVAVERNGEIVPRSSFGTVALEPGDSLEVVQFVQGG